ncbi:hypothetical protein [Paenibacillus polymyxa]|nr:hypothetical protein [Paenibacillus polymyxa]WPQ59598.1 NADH dehydrogenase subunit 6 [Paenibacillus polymyxa]
MNKALEIENKALVAENERLKQTLSWSYEQKTIINAFSSLANLNFDYIGDLFQENEIEKVEIHSFMRFGEADECFVGLRYGVKMFGINREGCKQEYLSIPVFEIGDGCFYNQRANARRLNTYTFTRHMADYIESEVLRGCARREYTITIKRTESKIDDLLYFKKEQVET